MTEPKQWQGEVERLAWAGLGIGRLRDGRIILLDSALALFPGEIVKAELDQKSRHAEGTVTQWVRRSESRVASGCPVGETCGACSLWEAGESAERLKKQMVKDLLHRQLNHKTDFAWLPAPTTAVRSRIQLHWDGNKLGFHKRRTNRIVAISGCPMTTDAISAAIDPLREALVSGSLPTNPNRWELSCGTPATEVTAVVGNQPDKAWKLSGDDWVENTDPLVHQFGEDQILQPAGAFFQASPQWAWDAFGKVLADWDVSGQALYDLYGGVGFFSVLLKQRFRHFVVVENNSASYRAALDNLEAMLASIEGSAEVHQAAIEDWLPDKLGDTEDVVLLDPPRSGLPKSVVKRLIDCKAGTLVLVGCDGMAFCRDVNRLAPDWDLKHLAAIDLFPNTPAVEFVGLLHRSKVVLQTEPDYLPGANG